VAQNGEPTAVGTMYGKFFMDSGLITTDSIHLGTGSLPLRGISCRM